MKIRKEKELGGREMVGRHLQAGRIGVGCGSGYLV
jgi:hypothetical protein